MTREEATKLLKMNDQAIWLKGLEKEQKEATEMAIKALETVSCIKEKCAYCPHCENCDVDDETLEIKALEQEPCEDCISRQAVDELSKQLVHTTRDKADFLCNFWEGLQKLPSVAPKEKTAAWVPTDEEPHEVYECNACGWLLYDNDRADFKYCPNCGARMFEPQESEKI